MRARAGLATVVAFAAIAVAYAQPVVPQGCTQSSHFALVRALADGTPIIDRWHGETCDKSYREGHWYSNKAPALAALLVPPYLALEATGNLAAHERYTVWLLGLLGTVLPALTLLVLVRYVGDRLDPGTGTLTAVALGLGTILLPFASILFSHVLAAMLAFAGFAVLFAERRGSPRLGLLLGAGALLGLAVAAEYPTALAGVALTILVLARRPFAPRLGIYAAGGVLGVLPLLSYQAWAFGSPFRTSYSDAVTDDGTTAAGQTAAIELGQHDDGLFGIELFHPTTLGHLLFDSRGVLVLTPVLLCGAVGLVLLFRRGARAEALAAGTVTALFVLYNAGLEPSWTFGGDSPGPRYLLTALPFLCLGVGTAFRAAPGAVGVLALGSVGTMTLAAATQPLVGQEVVAAEHWWGLVREGSFGELITEQAGLGAGWPTGLLFLGAVTVAVAATCLVLPTPARAPTTTHVLDAAQAALAWGLVLYAAPRLVNGYDRLTMALALVVAAGSAAAIAVRHRPRGRPAPEAAAPAAPPVPGGL